MLAVGVKPPYVEADHHQGHCRSCRRQQRDRVRRRILKHVRVSEATRGRVLEAATSMQYRPIRAARDWGAAIKKYLGLLWACFALLALTALTASADPITGIYRITPRV